LSFTGTRKKEKEKRRGIEKDIIRDKERDKIIRSDSLELLLSDKEIEIKEGRYK